MAACWPIAAHTTPVRIIDARAARMDAGVAGSASGSRSSVIMPFSTTMGCTLLLLFLGLPTFAGKAAATQRADGWQLSTLTKASVAVDEPVHVTIILKNVGDTAAVGVAHP